MSMENEETLLKIRESRRNDGEIRRKEIKGTIGDMNKNKARRPDEVSSQFYETLKIKLHPY